jgi:hypothetical protein
MSQKTEPKGGNFFDLHCLEYNKEEYIFNQTLSMIDKPRRLFNGRMAARGGLLTLNSIPLLCGLLGDD